MKILKSVTMQETASGETQFTPRGKSAFNADNNAPRVAPTKGTLGFRASKEQFPGIEQASVPAAENAARTKNVETAAGAADDVEQIDTSNLGPGVGLPDIVSNNAILEVLTGILPRHNPKQHSTTVCKIYRDMVDSDATTGSAVELLATMPWSEFSLAGLKDEKMTKTFVESIEAIHTNELLPNISVDYNMLGAVILSTRWSETERKYKGIAAHKLELCTFTNVPVFGVDPIIDISLSEEMLEGLRSQKVQELYKDYIPDDLLKTSEDGKNGVRITLSPENTIFIPRRGSLKNYSGTSLLQRALPAWIFEKALIRGTLDQVYKRQRAITHITIEQTEDYTPVQEEMNAITQLFLAADLDPLGAVVTTKSGINVNEVRRGEDFWKWTDTYDAIEKIKLRALGISENFVSGEANYSTMEQALSTFLEGVRDYRARMTNELFYQKMFPRIAHANGYTRKKYGGQVQEVASYGLSRIFYDEEGILRNNINTSRQGFEFAANAADINPSDYVTPQVLWRKRLMPEVDGDYLNVLNTLKEQGVPVSLHHWIAAGGMKVETLMDGLEQDLKLREKVFEYQQELKELEKEFGINQQDNAFGGGGEGEGGDGGMAEFARYLAAQRVGLPSGTRRKSILGRGDVDNPNAEIANYDSKGKRRLGTAKGASIRMNKYHKVIAEAAAAVAATENRRTRREESMIEPAKKYYTGD